MVPTTRWSSLAAFVVVLTLAACKTQAPYIWADTLPVPAESSEKAYVIQPGDQLSVRVWGSPHRYGHWFTPWSNASTGLW